MHSFSLVASLAALVLAAEPAPRPKPMVPVLSAQVLQGNRLGPELLDGVAKPVLHLDPSSPERWLAVEVSVVVAEAGSSAAVPLTLDTRQGKHRSSQKHVTGKSGEDVEFEAFFVEVVGCEPLELTVTVGRKVTTRTLAVSCD